MIRGNRAKYIFKDELCDAKFRKKSLKCQRGILHFTGDNVQDFKLYNAFCKGCDKIKIIERKDFVDCMKKLAEKIKEEFE